MSDPDLVSEQWLSLSRSGSVCGRFPDQPTVAVASGRGMFPMRFTRVSSQGVGTFLQLVGRRRLCQPILGVRPDGLTGDVKPKSTTVSNRVPLRRNRRNRWLPAAKRAIELLKNQGGVPKRRFAVIQTMRTEELPIQVACRVLEVRVRFLCLALPTAVSPFHPPRCAYRHHPPTVTRYPWSAASAVSAGALPGTPTRDQATLRAAARRAAVVFLRACRNTKQSRICVPTRV